MAQGNHSHYRKEKYENSKARLKPSRTALNTVVHTQKPEHGGKMWVPQDLGSPTPKTFLVGDLMASLRLSHLLLWFSFADTPCYWNFQILEVFIITSVSLPQLHTLPHQGHISWPSRLSFEFDYKPPWPNHSCILSTTKASFKWMMCRSASTVSSSRGCLDCGCSSLWVPGWLSMVK